MNPLDAISNAIIQNIDWKAILPPFACTILIVEGIKTKFKKATTNKLNGWSVPLLFVGVAIVFLCYNSKFHFQLSNIFQGIGIGLICYTLDYFYIDKKLNKYNQDPADGGPK